MATSERERYRQALAALEAARQVVARLEQLRALALARLRQAEVEGFEDDASRREERTSELTGEVQSGRRRVAELAARAEAQRALAVTEEIGEVLDGFDAALLRVIDDVERLAAAIVAAAAIADRAAALAEALPPAAERPHRMAASARAQARALDELASRMLTVLTQVERPAQHPSSGASPGL